MPSVEANSYMDEIWKKRKRETFKALSLNCKLIKEEVIKELKIRNKRDPFLKSEAPSLIHAEGMQNS